jgi:hypothetical protein
METAVGKSLRAKEKKTKVWRHMHLFFLIYHILILFPISQEDKVIRRELTAVLTPGTIVDTGMISNDLSTFILSVKVTQKHSHF